MPDTRQPLTTNNTPGRVFLVGAGPGDPGLITVRGLELLRRAQVVIYDRLVANALVAEIPADAEKIYVGKQASRHTLRQDEINALLVEKAKQGKLVVRLKGGDPFVFGRGGEEAEELVDAGIPFEVVPGITSAVAAPAYAGIPVTHRDHTASFAVVTGHEDPTKPDSKLDWAKLSTGAGTLVFLMGVENLTSIVQQLVSNGRPASTPIALVRWGTWTSQQVLTGTLEDIVKKVSASGFTAPAVTIVGGVVSLREKLRWFDNRPLFGKRVLVTRTREQAGSLSKLLAQAGAQPVEVPAIQVVPPESWDSMDGAISGLEDYDWVVFTSANGVQSFFGRLAEHGRDARALGRCLVAAIGPATAQALADRGIRPDYVPTEYVAEAVAEGLVELGVADTRILLARAAGAREALATILRDHDAIVDEVAAYRTVRPEGSSERIRTLLDEGSVDVATFASSSSVRNLVELAGEGALERLNRLTIACIGPITAETARNLGLRVDIVCSEYTIPALVGALERHFSQ